MKNKKTIGIVTLVIIIIVIVVVAWVYKKPNSITIPVTPISSSTDERVPTVTDAKPSVDSEEFKTNLTFSFPDHPSINFKVIKIKKVYDPEADYNHFAMGIEHPALVTVDLDITNNSDTSLNANYFQVIYNSQNQTLIAPYYIHTSYESNPMTHIVVSPTFIVPNDQKEVSLVVGVYPPIIYKNVEDLLSKSTDAFLINFEEKTAVHKEG